MSEPAEPPTRWRPGPGLLVTAAFIGPGTVATASRAGGEHGLALWWTLALAVVAAVVLQEMAARLGVVGRLGLAEAIRATIPAPAARRVSLSLVLVAIVLGNTAYQTGNLVGAGLGAELLSGLPAESAAAVLGVLIAVVLAAGAGTARLNAVLVAVVVAMSVAFVATAAAVVGRVDTTATTVAWVGMPAGSELTAIALLGTTVVPYNLFLHASSAKRRWASAARSDPTVVRGWVRHARWDTALAIGLGGVVTASILVTAAVVLRGTDQPLTPQRLAGQLEPLLGSAGEGLFAFGLLAAGVTSAITAPLAAGYAAAGAAPWLGDRAVRWVAAAVSLAGAAFAFRFGRSPQATIVVAQAANGVLLPLVACFLLWVMNRRDLLGEHRNGPLANTLGGAVVATAAALGVVSLWRLLSG